MTIGSAVRRILGPIEAPVSAAYRSLFVDIGALGGAIDAIPFGSRVLEVGVGDGMVASQVVSRRPAASVLGIDLVSDPGRLFEGDRNRVTFRTISTSDLRAEGHAPFDAIVITDVLHHVPVEMRASLLGDLDALLADDGVLLVKETVVTKSPGYWLGRFSDRWISGDRNVAFLTEANLRALVVANVSGLISCGRSTIRPWSTNLLLVWRRAST